MSGEGRITTFSPQVRVNDDYLAFWLQNVTLRLRREVCWKLQEHSLLMDPESHGSHMSKTSVSKGIAELNQARYWEVKQRFFQFDITAKYLTDQLNRKPPDVDDIVHGSLYWLADQLSLDDASIFVLSLALASHLDSAVGTVISLCLNDAMITHPTLRLAQKIWDRPEQILYLSDFGNILFKFGILEIVGNTSDPNLNNIYETPIRVPPLVANQLIFPCSKIPPILKPTVLSDDENENIGIDKINYVSSRIKNITHHGVAVVPILGLKKSSRRETVMNICRATNRTVLQFTGDRLLLESRNYLSSVICFCWLRNVDLYLDLEPLSTRQHEGGVNTDSFVLPLTSIPITVYLGISEKRQLANIPESTLSPIIEVPKLSYSERVSCWNKSLGVDAEGQKTFIQECSRRFRFDREDIKNVCKTLRGLSSPVVLQDWISSCWLEVDLDMGELSQKVIPRFTTEKLILPIKQTLQFQEVMNAMLSLTRVHYEWGTSEAWNESGISALFAGPSGTGKTMAAEILSRELKLPMYRIDLSHVVNKFVGETEKNLKKLFDKAEMCDMILFFDEADSLFGRRTEVKDAHDRYANLEINYLLERMERYRGLAILATNRIKDIDEAFLRRLRYIIEFPIPNVSQRRIMWAGSIPPSIDSSEIDIEFLARQFQLTGGNIRSIVFNACLQSAFGFKSGQKGKVTMENIIVAVKREYDKLRQAITVEQFGQYRSVVERIDEG